MNSVSLRPLSVDDFDDLRLLFNRCHPDGLDRESYPDYLFVIGAFHQLKLVAGLVLFQNPIHPFYLKCSVAVLPEFRHLGLGTNLHTAMMSEFSIPEQVYGLEMACYEQNLAGCRFIESLNYQHHFNCVEFELDLSESILQNSSQKSPFNGLQIHSFEDRVVSKDNLLNFLVQKYIDSHLWSPVSDISIEEWDQIVFSDLEASLSYYILIENEVAACSTGCLVDSCLELGWIYVNNPEFQSHLFNELLRNQLHKAKLAGALSACLEVDSYQEDLLRIVSTFSFKSKSSWRRYKMELPSQV
jgi:hypothetical protein